jgi:hypothetical protein
MDKIALISLLIDAGSRLLSWSKSPKTMKRLLSGEMYRNQKRIKRFLEALEKNGGVSFREVQRCVKELEYTQTEEVLNGMGSLSRLAYRKTPDSSEFLYRLRNKYLDEVFQKFVNNTRFMKEDFAHCQDCEEDVRRFTQRIKGRSEELAAAIYIMTK